MDYTKGPWHVSGDIKHLVFANDGTNGKMASLVAICDRVEPPASKRAVKVIQANAQLISASPEMYEALIGIGQIVLLTEWPAEERMEWIEAKVNRILAKIGLKNILSILSKGRTPELMTALDELGIPVKDGDNLRSISDILDDLSIKWQELEGRPD